jgi:hypothetical protein
MTTTDASKAAATRSPVADLSAILFAGLKALADAGEVEQACRLGGQACSVLRHSHGEEWRRFNSLLHRLAHRSGPVGVPASSGQDDRPGRLAVAPPRRPDR